MKDLIELVAMGFGVLAVGALVTSIREWDKSKPPKLLTRKRSAHPTSWAWTARVVGPTKCNLTLNA
jgi:hypothetical protein